jgi:hypothetical protein
MKIVQKYSTEDGQLFDTAGEAREHEGNQKLIAKLWAILRTAVNSGRSEAVITSIVVNATLVRDALSDFIRKQPKKNKAEHTLDDAL